MKGKTLSGVLILMFLFGGFIGYCVAHDDMEAAYHMRIAEQGNKIEKLEEDLSNLQNKYDGARHDILHYGEQAEWLYTENQRMHQELIDSGLYEIEYEIEGEFGTLRSYKKIEVKEE